MCGAATPDRSPSSRDARRRHARGKAWAASASRVKRWRRRPELAAACGAPLRARAGPSRGPPRQRPPAGWPAGRLARSTACRSPFPDGSARLASPGALGLERLVDAERVRRLARHPSSEPANELEAGRARALRDRRLADQAADVADWASSGTSQSSATQGSVATPSPPPGSTS